MIFPVVSIVIFFELAPYCQSHYVQYLLHRESPLINKYNLIIHFGANKLCGDGFNFRALFVHPDRK